MFMNLNKVIKKLLVGCLALFVFYFVLFCFETSSHVAKAGLIHDSPASKRWITGLHRHPGLGFVFKELECNEHMGVRVELCASL